MTREDPAIDKNLRVGGARWRRPNSKRERTTRAPDKRPGRPVRRRPEMRPWPDEVPTS